MKLLEIAWHAYHILVHKSFEPLFGLIQEDSPALDAFYALAGMM